MKRSKRRLGLRPETLRHLAPVTGAGIAITRDPECPNTIASCIPNTCLTCGGVLTDA